MADMAPSVALGLSASVLRIEAQRVQGGFSLGSAVVVAPEKVFTNCHVTHDALHINVLRGGVRWLAASQMRDVDHDLCLLRVPGLQASVVTLGQTDTLKPGQPLIAMGYSGGMRLQNSPGKVIALHRFDGGRVIQISNWFRGGASGGALFDEDLHLVGILTFRLSGDDAQYFAAPAEWLQAMLDAAGEKNYRDVIPDRSQRLAYWQRPVPNQPRFLQATRLQRDAQWPELEAMAVEWARADAGDPEPWYMMGVALAQMNRLPEAQHALECSLAIDSDSTDAWAQLVPVYRSQGQIERASQIESRLSNPSLMAGQAASRTPGIPCTVGAPASRTR
jgi:hypothetical protein